MLRDIYLHGELAERYGPHFYWDVDTVAECVSAFQANFGNFFQVIKDGRYQIIRGKDDYLSSEQLIMKLGKATELHIVPVVEGAGGGNKGILTAVLGLAMVAAAVVTAGAAVGGLAGLVPAMGTIGAELPILGCVTLAKIATVGGILALGGISQLLAPSPKVDDYGKREKEKTSFLFNGAVNRQEQGGPIPIIYGQVRVGSIVVSSGIDIEKERDNPTETGPKVQVWVTCSAGGTITVGNGENNIDYDGSITIEWTANAGWTATKLMVSYEDMAVTEVTSPTSPYTLNNIKYTTRIYVVFEES